MNIGQQVVVHTHTVGPWRYCIGATLVSKLKTGQWRVRDNAGATLEIDPKQVYPSQEAFEAAIPGLAMSVNTESGRITEFPGDKQ